MHGRVHYELQQLFKCLLALLVGWLVGFVCLSVCLFVHMNAHPERFGCNDDDCVDLSRPPWKLGPG
jgi:hypothetical protein